MATGGGNSAQLTNKQIVRLAAAISANNMAAIVEGYMDISSETIKNKKYENKDDSEAFNREIIRFWINKNPQNQVQKLAALLYEAADDCGCADPKKIERILRVSREKTVGSKCAVSEEELPNLAEDLCLHTARTMKMEPAPWIKDYVVDMEELYTELTIEKIDEKLFSEERKKLENYKELFTWHNLGILEYLDIRYYHPKLNPKMKILFKANPGMGKTSLVKKITWDWAQRLFVKVSIVFFVFLKLVKPGDFIEDAIIHQSDDLQGEKMTKKRLAYILDNFGQKCLLILDGLDECALGQNSDVLGVIRGSRFKNCNVVVTSRPHSTRTFEIFFDTIVRVEGFTRNEARKFARRIVDDERKVEQILNFNPAHERADRPVHNVPILLSFLCLLVREDNIELSHKTVSMGEIYFRMVQCLYKKFTIRKGIEFQLSSLVEVLMSLGRLALQTLLSGNSLLQRSQIIRDVGEEVFEYGLLIGEDGFSLTRDMTVDIPVSFPHRSLQEFLGAFYFVLSLGKKQTVHHMNKAVEEYLKSPLFSEFCLWFLDESNGLLSTPESCVACEVLSSYVSEPVNGVKIDFGLLVERYPALSLALVGRNKMALNILEGALNKCLKLKHLVLQSHHPNDRILAAINPVAYQRMNSIIVSKFVERREVQLTPRKSPLRFLCEWHDCSFYITVKCGLLDKGLLNALNTVLNVCESQNRSVYLHVKANKGDRGISSQDFPSVRVLNFDSRDYKPPMNQMYPHLVNLFLTNCNIGAGHLSNLAEANTQGRLPKLSTLEISDTYYIRGNLSVLLRSTFPSLQTLILSNCELQISDVESLGHARREARLPKFRHLDLSYNYSFDNAVYKCLHPLLFEQGISTLDTLVLRNSCINWNDLYQFLHQAVKNNKSISELTTLDMSCNPSIAGCLSAVISHGFPYLQILVLRECGLTSEDLVSLAQASNQGRLSELRHLDISQNYIHWGSKGISGLFGELKVFPSLINLVLFDCHLMVQDLCCLTQAKLDGKLPRIRHLDISLNGLSDHVGILSRDPIKQREISWGNVICYEDQISKDLLKTRTQMNEKKCKTIDGKDCTNTKMLL